MSSHQLLLTFHGIHEPAKSVGAQKTHTRKLSKGEAEIWLKYEEYIAILDECIDKDDIKITFDDGNQSDVDLALPALLKRGLSATFFLVVNSIDTPDYLSTSQIKELLNEGMQLGSHGYDHVPWFKMNSATAQREIYQAKDTLEQTLGVAIDYAACPFGKYDRNSLAHLRSAGFLKVFTSDGGWSYQNDWLCSRNSLRAGDPKEIIQKKILSRKNDFFRQGKTLLKCLR